VAKGDARMAKLNAVAAISSGEATPICNQYEAQTYTYTADFHSDESVWICWTVLIAYSVFDPKNSINAIVSSLGFIDMIYAHVF